MPDHRYKKETHLKTDGKYTRRWEQRERDGKDVKEWELGTGEKKDKKATRWEKERQEGDERVGICARKNTLEVINHHRLIFVRGQRERHQVRRHPAVSRRSHWQDQSRCVS